MKVENKVHKCISQYSSLSSAVFCTQCGVFMSRSKNASKFYRSEKYNLVEPFRLDGNLLLSEMVKKQHINRIYKPQAHFIKYRIELLGFMRYLIDRLQYSQCTFYLGVGILDTVLSQFKVGNDKLKLVCFMALHMAAKMEESSDKIPELSIIVKLFENLFNFEEMQEWEINILRSLGYNMYLKTPFTFIEYFLSRGVVNKSELQREVASELEEEINKFENKIMQITELSAKDYYFNSFSPVVVASAIIACARKAMRFPTDWSADLTILTGQKLEDIRECSKALYGHYMNSTKNGMEVEETKVSKPRSKSSTRTIDSDTSVDILDKSVKNQDNVEGSKAGKILIIDTDEKRA